MAKHLIFLWISLLAALPHTQGQATYGASKDSLKHLISTLPDTKEKVTQLITLGQQYEGAEPDSAIHFYQQAGQLSIRIKDHPGYIRYISNYTAVLNLHGKYEESLKLNLATIDTCIRYRLDTLSYMRAYINTGNAYEQIGQHDSAAALYMKALPFVEATGNLYRLTTIYNNLSGLYRNIRQLPKAYNYSRLALTTAEQSHDPTATANACINLGNTLKDMDSIQEGGRYIQRAYDISRHQQDSTTMLTALIDIGDTWLRLAKPEKYIPVYQQALTLSRTLNDVPSQAFALQGLAFGLFWTARYDEAAALLQQAIPIARNSGQKEVWRSLLLLMSDVQAIQGHINDYKKYRDLSDSVGNVIMNESLLKNISTLETKYEVEKNQNALFRKDIQLAEKDRLATRQQIWLIAAAAGGFLLITLFVLSLRISRQKRLLDNRTIRALEAEQENLRLKSRLEGQQQERQRISAEMHDDMGSGLTSLLFLSRSLPPETGPAAKKMTGTASDLIRKMNEIIWTMNHEQDTLDNLITYIRTHTADLAEDAGIDFRFHINGNADAPHTIAHAPNGSAGNPNGNADDRPISQELRRNIYLVTKEAVHNAVRHSGADTITVDIQIRETAIEIIVRDNGKGFPPSNTPSSIPTSANPANPAKTSPGSGNGQKNMRRRIEQIGGKFSIENDNGCKITISAPL